MGALNDLHSGTFLVADVLLLDALHLPPDTKILAAEFSERDRAIVLTVSHPDIATDNMKLCPSFTRRHDRYEFNGWTKP